MRKKSFSHLDQTKRDRIEALTSSGHKQKEIAAILKVNASTICRELSGRARKNGNYQADTAEHKARIKRSNSKYQGMKIEKETQLKTYIIENLKLRRSPDEIAGRMKKENRRPRVGKDAVYKWLRSPFGQRYCKYLCTKRYTKKKQKEDKTKRHIIPKMVRIHELPPEAASGMRYGDCEGDTFVSPKKLKTTASVALVVERKSKFLSGRKISSLKPDEMKKAVISIQQGIVVKTIVFDRGIENRSHEQFGIPSYFCDPSSPWQKPLVESSIGLLRRWFWPKGTNLECVSEEEFQTNLNIINRKYRKSLNYLSAQEVAKENGILNF